MKRKFKINGLGITDKQYETMPFGQKIGYARKIDAFKASAKTVHISQKRRTHAAAWKEFKALYNPIEWFTAYYDDQNVRDDVFEVWYTTA